MGLKNNIAQEETKPLKGYETSIYISPIISAGYQQVSIEPVSQDKLFSIFKGFQNQLPHPLIGVLNQDEFSDFINIINKQFLKKRNIFSRILFVLFPFHINGEIGDNIFDINSRLSSRGISFTYIYRRHRYVFQNINGVRSKYRVSKYSLYVQYPAIVTPVSIISPVQYQHQSSQPNYSYSLNSQN